eukprot:1150651-Prymnesium_polylepis.3
MVAPSLLEAKVTLIAPNVIGEPSSRNSLLGGRKSSMEPRSATPSSAERSWAIVPTVIKPPGPGINGGIGGCNGGPGGAGGAVGEVAQPATTTPASAHVMGQRSASCASSGKDGVNGTGQPAADAASPKLAMPARQTRGIPPKIAMPAPSPCAHSAPPVQRLIE